jgi:chromosome condensin MukBEF ATPase and DNA-binding subunit MukB
MTDNRTITWAFKIADNVTEGADEAAAAAEKAGKQTDEAKAKQEELKNTVDKTTAGITAQQARLAMQVTVIVGLQGAVSGLTSGIKALGITSDATNEKLTKINAAFQIMGGLANTVKALQLAMSMLNLATVKNALLNTYNAVVSNPAAIALVGAGAGAAVTAAVILGAQSGSSSTSTTNITVNGTSSAGTESTVQDVYTLVQGTV